MFSLEGLRLREERTVLKTVSVRWAPGWILCLDCLEVSRLNEALNRADKFKNVLICFFFACISAPSATSSR